MEIVDIIDRKYDELVIWIDKINSHLIICIANKHAQIFAPVFCQLLSIVWSWVAKWE